MALFLNDVTISDATGPLLKTDKLAGCRSGTDDLQRFLMTLIRQYCEGFYQEISTDADASVVALTDAVNIRHTGTLTADRVLTLSDTDAYESATFWVTRTGGGAFNLNVSNHDASVLKALTTNTWGKFVYDGTNWYLAATGAL